MTQNPNPDDYLALLFAINCLWRGRFDSTFFFFTEQSSVWSKDDPGKWKSSFESSLGFSPLSFMSERVRRFLLQYFSPAFSDDYFWAKWASEFQSISYLHISPSCLQIKLRWNDQRSDQNIQNSTKPAKRNILHLWGRGEAPLSRFLKGRA